jgi:predicted 3-demethylubiquinone-9 3-methyltransferase (glyoxalase superfamily)
MTMKTQKITPFLWFDKEAEEAANYYVSTFRNGEILSIQRYAESAVDVSGKPAGSVMTVEFEIEGMTFTALNGGPVEGFKFSPATSFAVSCDTQEEIDHLWEKLSAVPEAEQCGWCTDKFGITWQIVPTLLNELLSDSDTAKVERVTKAFMQMKKFDIAKLKEAAEGK